MPTTVAVVVERLGPALVRGAAGRLDRPVRDVLVTDPTYPAPITRDSLVVAVGFRLDSREFGRVCEDAAEAEAAGVVVKGAAAPGGDDLAVVVLDPDVDWAQTISLLRAATSMPSDEVHPEDTLFGLADALASLCGGPVVLHDAAWQLIAYSTGQRMDPVRNETILGRRAPVAALTEFRRLGYLDALKRGEVVDIPDDVVPGLTRRMAVAARAGAELLATIWLQPDPSTGDHPDVTDRLRRAADIAALTLLRNSAAGPAGARAGDAAFSELLGGARTERLVAEQLDVSVDAGFFLAGLAPATPYECDRAATTRRLVALARSYCDAFRVTAQVAAGADAAYLLFACADTETRHVALRVVTDIHARLQQSAPHRTMVSSRFRTLAETAAMRRQVDDLLALAQRRGWAGFTDSENVQASWRLEQFREVALAQPDLLRGPVMLLAEYDRTHGSEYVATLRAWFECVADTKLVGQRLGLHVNTVRYRVNKACEIAGIDLDDPDERLLAELQVRLLFDERECLPRTSQSVRNRDAGIQKRLQHPVRRYQDSAGRSS